MIERTANQTAEAGVSLQPRTGGAALSDAGAGPCALSDFTPYLIARVGSLMERTIAPSLRRAGLTIDMWRVMMVLRTNGPMSLIALSGITGVTNSTLSRLVGRMIEMGLVSRRRSTGDTRTVRVRLRDKGEALFEELWPTAARLEALATADFDQAGLTRFKTDLRTIEAALVGEIEAGSGRKRWEK